MARILVTTTYVRTLSPFVATCIYIQRDDNSDSATLCTVMQASHAGQGQCAWGLGPHVNMME